MSTAKEIVAKALSFVGTKESPAGSNNVIFNTDYYGHPVSGSAYPWCVTFVWDVFRLCGASALFYDGKKTASCIAVQDWGKKAGLEIPKIQGRKGDLILMDWNGNGVPDHIGIVVEQNPDGSYATVEGNTSVTSNDNGGNVMRRTRYTEDVCCMLRPRYEEEDNMEIRYQTVAQLPESLRAEAQALIDCGALQGVNVQGDLDVTLDMLRCMIVAKRYTDWAMLRF